MLCGLTRLVSKIKFMLTRRKMGVTCRANCLRCKWYDYCWYETWT